MNKWFCGRGKGGENGVVCILVELVIRDYIEL